jgi:hypothetical protein
VLGLLPDSWDATNPQWWPDWEGGSGDSGDSGDDDGLSKAVRNCGNGSPKKASWCKESNGAYPNDPDYAQKELSRLKGGVVTGYFLEDGTGVLSIPSFLQQGNDLLNFFDAIDDFLRDASGKNTSRLIIDLQQNYGGLKLLAVSVFKRFFYDREPWTGSRIRTTDMANTLGESYSSWWSGLETGKEGALDPNYQYFASSEWVVGNRINPSTGANYSSWDEYKGPVSDRHDTFSNLQLYNLSDQVFDSAGFQGWIPYGYGDEKPNPPPSSWAPDSIVLLTDGLCTSACAVFVELMAEQGGVKTVVVGGRPAAGPMQSASGSRGARLYSSEALDYDFSTLNDTIEDREAFARLPQRGNNDLFINFAGFNIRDQIRAGDKDAIPVQFKYDAADCRVYYTLQNIYNLKQLWKDVAAAAWDDQSLCVEGSTGYSVRNNATNPKTPPKRTAQAPNVDLEHITFSNLASNISGSPSLYDLIKKASVSTTDLRQCFDTKTSKDCKGTVLHCRSFPVDCTGEGKVFRKMSACLEDATNYNDVCGDNMVFQPTTDAESKKNVAKKNGVNALYEPVTVTNGYCVPLYVDAQKFSLGCPLQ